MNESQQKAAQGQLRENLQLAESSRWAPLCAPLLDRSQEKAALVARLCENTAQYFDTMDEDVRSLNVGTFNKFVFPMIRATYANLISTDLFSVQPMSGPTALIFFLDTLYGATKGTITKGDTAESALLGHNDAFGYPMETVTGESVGTGNGSATVFPATLAWVPVRKGTFSVTAGSVVGTDDSNGLITGAGISAGTINYSTGAVSVTFSSAPANALAITASYEYQMEGNDLRPSLDLIVTSDLVTARTVSLQTKWSIEAEQDFRSVHGIEATALLMGKVAEQLRYEIDRSNISAVTAAAAQNGAITWDYTPPAGVDFYRHQLTFVNTLIDAGNRIFKATRGRATGNWLVAGTQTASVIEALPQFQAQDVGDQKGVVKIGKLLQWDIYKDPWFASSSATMGHKGSDWLEAGYAYCPYVPLWRTPVITLSDMVRRVGLMSRYGRKLINKLYYLNLNVSNYGVLE